jgi:hypothetical protein
MDRISGILILYPGESGFYLRDSELPNRNLPLHLAWHMDRYSLPTRHIDSPRYTLMNPSRTSHGGVVLSVRTPCGPRGMRGMDRFVRPPCLSNLLAYHDIILSIRAGTLTNTRAWWFAICVGSGNFWIGLQSDSATRRAPLRLTRVKLHASTSLLCFFVSPSEHGNDPLDTHHGTRCARSSDSCQLVVVRALCIDDTDQ